MKKRIVALILALVMVFDMGAVALANGTGTDLPAEDEPKQEETVTEEQQEDPAAEEQQEESVTKEQIEESPEEVTLVSIEVTTLPDKVEYLCTDTAVVPAGGLLTLTYSDSSTETVELSAASLSALTGDEGEVSVTVSYEGMTDSFAVTVSHSYDDGVVTTEPTATEAGVMTYTCENCGDEQTSEIPMAVSEEISGTCGAQGNNLTWTFSDGVLTISGSGAMAHYTSADDESRPWIPYLKDIRKIVVGSNVDEIDNYAFAGCTNAESITVPFIGGGAESNMFLGYVFGAPPAQGIVGEYNPDYVPGSLKSVTVTNADAIGIGSFHGCSSLESVDISGNVSAVGDYAFYGCSALKTVSIPDSATSIGNSAFYECASLTGFTIPDDVTVIGEYAFSGCRGLETVNIPENVKEIKDYAFCGLVKVKIISIPNSVTAIGADAFGECYSLEEVNIPTGITAINDGTFIGCMALKSVVIPQNIISIGRNAFYGCSDLGEITFEGDAPSISSENAFGDVTATAYYDASKNWTDDDFQNYGGTITWEAISRGTCGANGSNLTWDLSDGVLTISGKGKMADYSNAVYNPNYAPWHTYKDDIKSVIINEGVTSIGSDAFCGCGALESVTIPDGVTEIGGCAFYGCSSLKSITIPDSVTEIGSFAFYRCSLLRSVTIPDGVDKIYDYTFDECNALERIVIPASVTSMGRYAVGSPRNIHFGGTEAQWVSVLDKSEEPGISESIKMHYESDGNGIKWEYKDGVLTISGSGKMDAYDTFANSPWAQYSDEITEVVITSGVIDVGENAFYGYESLEKVTLPEGMTQIEDIAFAFCDSLAEVNFPDSITSIGEGAFCECRKLTNAALPANLKEMGMAAFQNCGMSEIEIPEGVASLSEFVFYGCNSIDEIIIPETVTAIENYALGSCGALGKMTFEGDAPTIDDYAFTGVTATAYYNKTKKWTSDDFQDYGGTITWKPIVEIIASGICGAQGDNLTWTLDSEGVLTISGEGAMKNYSNNYGDANYAPWHGYTKDIKKIFIEDGATAIGKFAFYGCYAFSDITIPESVKRIEGGAFDGCNALEKITLPDGLEHLGDAAFLSCVKLVDVNIPSGLNEIGEATFCGCRSLAKIVIPDNIAAIGDLAFEDCSALSMVNIPESVKTIGNGAFSGCSALKKLTLHKDVSIGHAVFAKCGFETAGPIGSGSDIEFGWGGSIPEYAFQGCAALKSIIIPDDVTVIGEGAFKACTSLTDITIPSGVNAIQDQTFHSCGALADVIIPNNVSSIGKQAFLDCASLSIVTIPEKVDSISDSAFWGCIGLKEINFQGDAPIMGEYTFNEVTATAYYFADKDWTQDDLQDYSGHITWVARLSPDYKAIISGKDSMKSGEKLNLVAILSPRNVTDTTIEWRLAEGDEVAASITGKWDEDTDTATATVTALPVSEINEITVIAYTADGLAVSGEHRITVIPAPTAVTIKDEAGNEVTGGTVGVNVNETKELIFAASIFPEGAEGAIEWTSSDTKGAYGSYTDNGDGTVTAIIEDGIRSGSITLTATEKGSGAKATVKLSITSVTTDLELGADNEGIAGEPSLGEITAEEKAAALVGGQSRVLSVILHGEPSKANVIWSIPAEYAPFASIKAGTVKNGIATAAVKANEVSGPVQIKVVAEAADNAEATAEMWLWIVPATTGVAIEDADGNGVTGTTVLFDLNGEADNIVFTAATTPADSKDGVTWTSSDKTGAMGSIAVGDDGNLIFTPADTVAAGKTVTFTATAADGSKKSAKVTVKFANLAHEINILNAPETLVGGKYVTLKTDVQADKTLTDKTVEWKLREQDYEYASITSAGKLTAKAFAGEPVEIQVTAIVKATGAESDPVTITLNPNLTSGISILLNGVNVNGTTQKVDVREGQITLTAKAVGLEGQDIVWGPAKATGAAYFADPASGVLTLNKEGAVTITAAAGKTKATFKLTAATPVEQLAIDGNDVMTGGTKQTLKVNFTDADGNAMKPTNSKVTWEITSCAEYAAIKNGVLTAAKVTEEHDVTLVATAEENGRRSAPFTVSIKPASSNVMVYIVEDGAEINLTDGSMMLDVGSESRRSIQLMARTYPYYEGQPAVTWKSSSPAVASVDENGLVKVQWDEKKECFRTGKVTITATAADGSKKSAKVTLNLVQLMDSIELPETMGIAGGKHIKFRTMIDERATKKDIVWSMTGDTEWAKLNNGKLITKKVTSPKTVTVTATAADGGGAAASCVVTIYPAVTAVSIFSGGTNVTGSTVDFDDGMTFTLKNSPNSAYKSWTAKSSNAGILASIEGDTLTITRNPEKTLKANTKVTITVTAADGSGKRAKVTVVVK